MFTLSEYLQNKLDADLAAAKKYQKLEEEQIKFQSEIKQEITGLKEQNAKISDTVETIMTEIIPPLQEANNG